MAAGELMVIDVVTSPSGMPSKSISMSWSEVTATPHFPTSPSDSGWSGSRPIRVGRSKATDRPWLPCSSRYLKRSLVCCAEPKPANWRMVQARPRYMRLVDAAGEGELPRVAEVAGVVEVAACRPARRAARWAGPRWW